MVATRTLIVKMHEYKKENLLIGENEKEEYDFFCANIVGDITFIQELLVQFQLIGRCLLEKIRNIVQLYKELIERFQKDRNEIQLKLL